MDDHKVLELKMTRWCLTSIMARKDLQQQCRAFVPVLRATPRGKQKETSNVSPSRSKCKTYRKRSEPLCAQRE